MTEIAVKTVSLMAGITVKNYIWSCSNYFKNYIFNYNCLYSIAVKNYIFCRQQLLYFVELAYIAVLRLVIFFFPELLAK